MRNGQIQSWMCCGERGNVIPWVVLMGVVMGVALLLRMVHFGHQTQRQMGTNPVIKTRIRAGDPRILVGVTNPITSQPPFPIRKDAPPFVALTNASVFPFSTSPPPGASSSGPPLPQFSSKEGSAPPFVIQPAKSEGPVPIPSEGKRTSAP